MSPHCVYSNSTRFGSTPHSHAQIWYVVRHTEQTPEKVSTSTLSAILRRSPLLLVRVTKLSCWRERERTRGTLSGRASENVRQGGFLRIAPENPGVDDGTPVCSSQHPAGSRPDPGPGAIERYGENAVYSKSKPTKGVRNLLKQKHLYFPVGVGST